jgi:hypothetical protein
MPAALMRGTSLKSKYLVVDIRMVSLRIPPCGMKQSHEIAALAPWRFSAQARRLAKAGFLAVATLSDRSL